MLTKKILTAILVLCTIAVAHAQDTALLKEYVGTYKFPEGSYVTSAEITLKDSVLSVNSAQGASPLERKAKDTFALTNYDGGMAYFFRNSNGKVARIKVEVGDVLLEGTKDGVTAWINRNYFWNKSRESAVK